jgi:hypothetical protein
VRAAISRPHLGRIGFSPDHNEESTFAITTLDLLQLRHEMIAAVADRLRSKELPRRRRI